MGKWEAPNSKRVFFEPGSFCPVNELLKKDIELIDTGC